MPHAGPRIRPPNEARSNIYRLLPKSSCGHSGQGDKAFQKKPHHPVGQLEHGFFECVLQATGFGQQPIYILCIFFLDTQDIMTKIEIHEVVRGLIPKGVGTRQGGNLSA
jgi:hypothetical protein